MSEHFLSKSQLRLADCLSIDGNLVLEQHAALKDLLEARLGRDAADLLAEPFLSRDSGGQGVTVAWYSDHPGENRALSDLDPAQRRQIEDRLHVLIPRIEALAREPALSPLIRPALSLASADGIRAVGGMPVLVGWGVRSRAEISPLAPYARGAETVAPDVATAAPRIATPPVAAASAPELAPAPMVALGPQIVDSRLHPVAWVPLVVLLLLAFLTLAWLLLPGTRAFPVLAGAQSGVRESSVDGVAAEANAALKARRDALLAALNGAQCKPNGALVLPGDMSPDGLPASPAAGGADQAQLPAKVAPDAALAPPLDRVTVPDGSADASQTDPLLDTIEARTVLVLAGLADGTSSGSGFVVGPGLIVTNAHVVEGALPGKIMVTNHLLGHPLVATVLKNVGPLETAGADFALLKIDDTSLPAYDLSDPTSSIKLHHVVAAGFPGDLLETDSGFTSLLQGNVSAMPDLSVVDGTVNAEQEMMPGTRVLVHSAPLASGNSGGPLVDYCGHVVGVNTFVRQGPMRTLNFALASSDLIAFLHGTTAAPVVTTSACAPTVTPQLGPVPQARLWRRHRHRMLWLRRQRSQCKLPPHRPTPSRLPLHQRSRYLPP